MVQTLWQEWKRSHFTNLQHSAEAAGGSRWWKTPWFHGWIIARNEDGSCSVAMLWLARKLLNHQDVVISWDVRNGYIKAHLLDRELFPFLNHPKFFFPLPTSQHIPTPIPIPTTQPQPPGPPSPSARSTPAGWKATGRSSVASWASNFPLFPGSRWCARRASHGCHGKGVVLGGKKWWGNAWKMEISMEIIFICDLCRIWWRWYGLIWDFMKKVR